MGEYGYNDYRDYLEHASSHKYILKIGSGKNARYFYTQEEVNAFKQKARKVGEKTVNAGIKVGTEAAKNSKDLAKTYKKVGKEAAKKYNKNKVDLSNSGFKKKESNAKKKYTSEQKKKKAKALKELNDTRTRAANYKPKKKSLKEKYDDYRTKRELNSKSSEYNPDKKQNYYVDGKKVTVHQYARAKATKKGTSYSIYGKKENNNEFVTDQKAKKKADAKARKKAFKQHNKDARKNANKNAKTKKILKIRRKKKSN